MSSKSTTPSLDQVNISSTSSVILVNPSARKNDAWTWQKVSLHLLNILQHALVLAVTIYLCYWGAGNSAMNYHVILCTVGYVLCMSEALQLLSMESVWTKFLSRRNKAHAHWILQMIGMVCSVVGVAFMYDAKKNGHFLSTHGLIGVISIGMMLGLVLFGYPVLFAVKLRKLVRPVIVKFIHNFAGITCFALGIAAQCYGYQKSWLVRVTQQPGSDTACLVATVFIAFLAVVNPVRSLLSQLKTIFR